jgi:hypothetical protein
MKFISGLAERIRVNLVGGQHLQVKLQDEIGINMGRVGSFQEFLVWENDVEDIFMGEQWRNSMVGAYRADMTTMEVFPESNREAWENCYINPDFLQLDSLKGHRPYSWESTFPTL